MGRKLALLVLLPLVAYADDKPAFRVDVVAPTACKVAAPCEARLKLSALAGFKVNEEYPFKFVADTNSAVAVDGPGTFARDDEKTGTLTLKLRPQRAGKQTVTGTFKLSICTADVCKIEASKVTISVPVR